MSLGLMLLAPASQDVKAVWSSSLGSKVMTEEAFYSSEDAFDSEAPKNMGICSKICKQVLIH